MGNYLERDRERSGSERSKTIRDKMKNGETLFENKIDGAYSLLYDIN